MDANSVRISWISSAAATSQVEFGADTRYGMATTATTSYATSHSVLVGGLTTGNTYHFRVVSRDALGNIATSTDRTFRPGVLYQTDFEGPSPFGFEAQHQSTQSSITAAPGAGWNGSQAAHIVEFANQRQYNLGWYFGSSNLKPGGWRDGDIIYIRLRIKYDANWRWDGEGSMQNKMVDFGLGGDGSSRVILHQEAPHQTTPCGLPVSNRPNYGGLSVKIGITLTCTPPVAITYDTWYHVQFAVQSSHGTTPDGYFKLWVNNNDVNRPSSQLLNFAIPTGNGGVTYWNQGIAFGGFITDYPLRNQGWVVDDFQVSDSFDPNWYPGT